MSGASVSQNRKVRDKKCKMTIHYVKTFGIKVQKVSYESPDKKSFITLAPNVIVDKLSFGILARAPFYSGKEQCRFFSFVVNFISALLGAFSSTLLSYILNVQSCRTKKSRVSAENCRK